MMLAVRLRLGKFLTAVNAYVLPAGVVLLFLFLWIKSQAVNSEQHQRYISNLRQIQELDARINQNVLQTRLGLLRDYDPIVNEQTKLRQILADLQQIPSYIESDRRQILNHAIEAYIQVKSQKEKQIERFKSQKAVLSNSLTYFPTAIADLTKNQTINPTLANRLNKLLRDTLLYNLSNNQELKPQIEKEIKQILTDARSTNQSTNVERAIAHARIILEQSPKVNRSVNSTLALPTRDRGEDIAQAYYTAHEQALDNANLYRLELYLLSTIIIIWVAASIIYKLRTSAIALQQSEAKLRTIFENSQVGIFRVGREDNLILDANQRLVSMLGYNSATEIIGHKRSHQFYVNLDERQQIIKILQTHGEVHNIEIELKKRDGTLFWGLLSARLNATENCIEGVITDISERKQTEEELRLSEANYRALVQTGNWIVVRSNAQGQITFLNDYGQRFFGYQESQILGRSLLETIIPETETSGRDLKQLVSNVFEEPESYLLVENENICSDGKRVWIAWSNKPILDEHGQLLEILSVGTDITQRKRTESALQQSETKFRNIFENSQVGIFRTRFKDGLILDANQHFATLMGHNSPTEMIGQKRAFEFYANKSDRIRMLKILRTNGEIHNFEAQFRRCDGSVYWGLFSARLNVEEGYLEGVHSDISDRKLAEAALEQAKVAAEAANHAKTQFLSHMSHELRTPLSVILGFTQLLSRSASHQPKQQEYLETISRSGEHLLILINDILEMSKIEADRVTINEQDCNLYYLLDGLQQMFQFKATSKGLQFIVERSPDLPQFIRTDESKLRQVLFNLVGNAVKFTQTGSVTLRVKLGTGQEEDAGRWRHGDMERVSDNFSTSPRLFLTASNETASSSSTRSLIFEVEDTGPGIAAEELDHLFEPFGQTETGRRSQEGTGLGLPISRKFVQLMGGSITVESTLGQGSCFRFHIQAKSTEADVIPLLTTHQQVIGIAAGQPTYRIMIVEDKLSNRRLLVELLKPIGFEVREVENGIEAIALWQNWEPHLIWMDLQMPVMDGYEATKQIKSSEKAPIIIALTGSAFAQEQQAALDAGCDDFIRKPYRAEVIFEKMTQYLGVRYVYAHKDEVESIKNEKISSAFSLKPTLREGLSPTSLTVMSPEWVKQLHQAAICVNAKLLHQLIEQIPESHADVANAIAHLIDNFRFEEIINLTRQENL
ncbi:MAG: PAS domain S-box protein [Fischerella sp. CENA71]|nr:PAS domain S-box protein [Fischerella sp. CENA71]